MKRSLYVIGFALTMLVLLAASVLYFTGPTTKTVTKQVWQDRHCMSFRSMPRPLGDLYGENREDSDLACIGWAPAGYEPVSTTLRTSAWERISGAITGSGDVDSSD